MSRITGWPSWYLSSMRSSLKPWFALGPFAEAADVALGSSNFQDIWHADGEAGLGNGRQAGLRGRS